MLKSFTMKSENTYNQKLAHCVRWHQHLKLSFSRLLHYQPLLVCAVRNCVNWNTPIHVAWRKRWCDLWNWSETKETVASQSNLVGVLCGTRGDMWHVTRDTRMEKFPREKGPKTHTDSIIHIFLHLSPICHDKMFLYWCVTKCHILCKTGDETRRGRRGEEEKRQRERQALTWKHQDSGRLGLKSISP